MITIDKLNSFGANTAEGLGRCFGNEALYLRLVDTIPSEQNFEKLEKSIGEGNLDAAFEAAHALKGVLGNLSLTPLYTPMVEITELLRNKSEADYAQKVASVLELKEQLKGLCGD